MQGLTPTKNPRCYQHKKFNLPMKAGRIILTTARKIIYCKTALFFIKWKKASPKPLFSPTGWQMIPLLFLYFRKNFCTFVRAPPWHHYCLACPTLILNSNISTKILIHRIVTMVIIWKFEPCKHIRNIISSNVFQ